MNEQRVQDVSTAIFGGADRQGTGNPPSRVPALTVIAHPVPHRTGDAAILPGLLQGQPVTLSRNQPDFTQPDKALGRPLNDPHISRKPLLLSAESGGAVRISQQNSSTRVTVGGSLLQGSLIVEAHHLEAGVPIVLSERVVLLMHHADIRRETGRQSMDLVGHSSAIRKVREDVRRVADLDVPVLIRGETGTGKELVAQALHQQSPRARRPFISVNVAAIPKELAAAELFGARKGAFTGAVTDREGYFRAANGGVLFLDEVGDMPQELQVALLRVLEMGEVTPVGSQRPMQVDVRLITATDADLENMIEDGTFRAPLLHRLAGYSIWLPPLRERREDIGRLFLHFARAELSALNEAHVLDNHDPYAEPWLPADLAEKLITFDWPGNVRQLRNVTRQLVIGSRGSRVLRLDEQLQRTFMPAQSNPSPVKATKMRRRPADIGEDELIETLRHNDWDIKPTAEDLGIPRSSIYELMKRSKRVRNASDLSVEEIRAAHHQHSGDLTAMGRALEVSRHALKRRLGELNLD